MGKSEKRTIRISLDIEKSVHEMIKSSAWKNHRSMANEIRHMIENHLNQQRKKKHGTLRANQYR